MPFDKVIIYDSGGVYVLEENEIYVPFSKYKKVEKTNEKIDSTTEKDNTEKDEEE